METERGSRSAEEEQDNEENLNATQWTKKKNSI